MPAVKRCASVSKRPPPKRRVTRSPRRQYGPVTPFTQVTFGSSVLEFGTRTTPFGWVYGKDLSYSASHGFDSIASSVREIKALSCSLELTFFPLHDRQDFKLTPVLNDATKPLSLTNFKGFTGNVDNPVGVPYIISAHILDAKGSTDTGKFQSVDHMLTNTVKCGGKWKYANANRPATLRLNWKPTESSERDWNTRKQDELNLLFNLRIRGTTLTDSDFAKPGGVEELQRIMMTVHTTTKWLTRGTISLVTRPMPLPFGASPYPMSTSANEESTDQAASFVDYRPRSPSLPPFDDLHIRTSPSFAMEVIETSSVGSSYCLRPRRKGAE